MEVRVGRCDLGRLAGSGQEQHPHRGWPIESCCVVLESRLEQRQDWPPLLVETRYRYQLSIADGVPRAHAAIAQIHTDDPIGSECARRGRLVGRRDRRLDSLSSGPCSTTTDKGEQVGAREVRLAWAWRLRRRVGAYPTGSARFVGVCHINGGEDGTNWAGSVAEHCREIDPAWEPGQKHRPHRGAAAFPP